MPSFCFLPYTGPGMGDPEAERMCKGLDFLWLIRLLLHLYHDFVSDHLTVSGRRVSRHLQKAGILCHFFHVFAVGINDHPATQDIRVEPFDRQ